MPLIIIDYVRENYSILHNGFLRKYLEQELKYVEGQVLEVYEGWLGREKVRMVNARVTALYDHKYILLPRDTMLKYGIAPRSWIVFSVTRVGDPVRDIFYPIYPGRIVPYAPAKDLIIARLEDLMLRSSGLTSFLASIIYRAGKTIEDIRKFREETRKSHT